MNEFYEKLENEMAKDVPGSEYWLLSNHKSIREKQEKLQTICEEEWRKSKIDKKFETEVVDIFFECKSCGNYGCKNPKEEREECLTCLMDKESEEAPKE